VLIIKINMKVIEKVNHIDKVISSYLHQIVLRPRLLELLILPFALFFSPFGVPVLIYLVGFRIPSSIKDGVIDTVNRKDPYHTMV
jgi:hypothetical protein